MVGGESKRENERDALYLGDVAENIDGTAANVVCGLAPRVDQAGHRLVHGAHHLARHVSRGVDHLLRRVPGRLHGSLNGVGDGRSFDISQLSELPPARTVHRVGLVRVNLPLGRAADSAGALIGVDSAAGLAHLLRDGGVAVADEAARDGGVQAAHLKQTHTHTHAHTRTHQEKDGLSGQQEGSGQAEGRRRARKGTEPNLP